MIRANQKLTESKKITLQYLDKQSKIVRDYEKNAPAEHLELVHMIFNAIEARRPYDEIYTIVDDLLKGEFSDSETYNNFSVYEAFILHKTKSAIFDVSALDIELESRTAKGDDSAQALNYVFNAILDDNYFEFTFNDAIQTSRAFPMAITMLEWDPFKKCPALDIKGSVKCKTISISKFWWDPSSNNIDECDYAFIFDTYSHYQLKKFFEKLNNVKDSFFNSKLYDAVINVYQNDKTSYIIQTVDNTMNRLITNQMMVNMGALPLITMFVLDRENEHVDVYYLLDCKFVVAATRWKIPLLPFAILKEHQVSDSFTGMSTLMCCLPVFKAKAKVDETFDTYLTALKEPTILIDGSSKDADLIRESIAKTKANQAGDIITINTNIGQLPLHSLVHIVATPQIPNEIYNYRNALQQEINNLSYSTDAVNGVNYGSAINGAAVDNMISQGLIKENTTIIELKKYLVRFVEIMIAMFKNNLLRKQSTATARVYNTLGDETAPQDKNLFVEITKEQLELLDCDIKINADLLRISKKQQGTKALMETFTMLSQYNNTDQLITLEDIIRTLPLNYKHKHQILNRISNNSEKQKLQQATELVGMVIQMLQDPKYQNVSVEQLVLMVVQILKQRNIVTEAEFE